MLLLMVGGNLTLSWIAVRKRLAGFTLLRALGSTPGQVAGILFWEQSLIYIAALLAGVLFGGTVSLLTLPALIFTNIPYIGQAAQINGSQFYLLQNVPTVHTVVPIWSIIGLLAGLVAICVLASGMMVRVVTRPQMSQEMCVDQDE